jgi:hypothetical protein
MTDDTQARSSETGRNTGTLSTPDRSGTADPVSAAGPASPPDPASAAGTTSPEDLAGEHTARRPVRQRLAAVAAPLARAMLLLVVLGVALLVLGAAASSLYAQYGFHPEANARAWANRSPAYADPNTCAGCHAVEQAALRASSHVSISCESCHGPAAAHAAASPAASVHVFRPAGGMCATCHERVVGRPASFPQLDPGTHYDLVPCLRCHAAHSVAATRPTRISHPLANLPACGTCHGPQGMEGLPQSHEPSNDDVCLSCHAPDLRGRGTER